MGSLQAHRGREGVVAAGLPRLGGAFGPLQYPTPPLAQDEQNVIRRVSQYLTARDQRQHQPPPPVAAGYDPADLAVLLGGMAR